MLICQLVVLIYPPTLKGDLLRSEFFFAGLERLQINPKPEWLLQIDVSE